MADPAQDNAPTLRPGDVISGKYRVERELGTGGMGVVLSARHIDLGEQFAIKLVSPAFAKHPEAVARFMREARAAARIKSEHVARVHDVGKLESGAPYMVMEHLTGIDLDRVVRERGPLPIDEALDYVLQACEAIAEAHAAGIVHRDLKPANLFLTHRADGSPLVKVLDFGMSKITAAESAVPEHSITATATVLGSPHYMSPEQVRSSKHVDARSDVWSLGVILHKLLTGAQVFPAETLSSCLAMIVTDPPARLRERRPSAPVELEAVILRCLEKSVERRMQSVAALARGLDPFAPRSGVSVQRIVKVLEGRDPPLGGTVRLPTSAPAQIAEQEATAIWRPDPVPLPSVPQAPAQAHIAPRHDEGAPQPPGGSMSGAWAPTPPGETKRDGKVRVGALAVAVAVGVGVVCWRLSVRPPRGAEGATSAATAAPPVADTSTPPATVPAPPAAPAAASVTVTPVSTAKPATPPRKIEAPSLPAPELPTVKPKTAKKNANIERDL